MDGLETSEIMLSALERTMRVDAEFYKKENLHISSMLQKWDKKAFTDYFAVSDGNHMSISENFCDEGVPYYRGQDIYHLFIENASPLNIDHETFSKRQMIRSHLKKGDVLMSIVGAIVGNSALVTSERDATCSCKLAIMRSKEMGLSPEMLLVFIKTLYGQNQIQKFKRGAAQTGILLEDFDQFYIPVFSCQFQSTIATLIEKIKQCEHTAIEKYKAAEATVLLPFSSQLAEVTINSYSIKPLASSYGLFGRIDSEYYQARYDEYEQIVLNHASGYTYIKDQFTLVKEKCARDLASYPYVEIGDIRISDGSASANWVATEDLPDNAKTMTHKGDLLVSTVRPNRGAVAILDDDNLLVSGAFTVLREKGHYPKEILQVLLRTKLYKDWLLRYNVGTSYPVIKDDDVLNMPLPIFDESIVDHVVTLIRDTSVLQRKAKALLDVAVCCVEMAVEQGEQAAYDWLKAKEAE